MSLPIPATDTELVDELENFVRTPEWTVSMFEDIAELVHAVRPDLVHEPDLEDGDARTWRSH